MTYFSLQKNRKLHLTFRKYFGGRSSLFRDNAVFRIATSSPANKFQANNFRSEDLVKHCSLSHTHHKIVPRAKHSWDWSIHQCAMVLDVSLDPDQIRSVSTEWTSKLVSPGSPEISLQPCLAPFYLANEIRRQRQPVQNAISTFNSTYCVGHLWFWCLRPSGRNLGTLWCQVTISAVPKCGVILTLCSWAQWTHKHLCLLYSLLWSKSKVHCISN